MKTLRHKIELYLPVAVMHRTADAALEYWERRLTVAFGGCTTYDAQGSWCNDVIAVIREQVKVLVVWTHETDIQWVVEAFSRYCKQNGEHAVMTVINGVAEIR